MNLTNVSKFLVCLTEADVKISNIIGKAVAIDF